VIVLRVLAVLVVLFVAYVVGRAVGILTGIGPWPTTALAMALAVAAIVWAVRRPREVRDSRDGHDR
jgi:hypothetical protein